MKLGNWFVCSLDLGGLGMSYVNIQLAQQHLLKSLFPLLIVLAPLGNSYNLILLTSQASSPTSAASPQAYSPHSTLQSLQHSTFFHASLTFHCCLLPGNTLLFLLSLSWVLKISLKCIISTWGLSQHSPLPSLGWSSSFPLSGNGALYLCLLQHSSEFGNPRLQGLSLGPNV